MRFRDYLTEEAPSKEMVDFYEKKKLIYDLIGLFE